MPLGWYGGWVVLTRKPSGVTRLGPDFDRPREHRRGRARLVRQVPRRVQRGAVLGRRARVGRGAGAHQPLVIEERAAEGAHEEVVGERVVLRPLPQLHLRAVEVAHHPGADVRHGDEPVVPAAVDLLAVLVIQVPGARQHRVELAVDRRRVDAERPVRHAARREARIRLAVRIHRRQVGQRLAVVIDLRLLRRARLRQALGAGEHAVKVVEAAVLGVDHHHGVDLVEARAAGRLARAAGGERRGANSEQSAPYRIKSFHYRPRLGSTVSR